MTDLLSICITAALSIFYLCYKKMAMDFENEYKCSFYEMTKQILSDPSTKDEDIIFVGELLKISETDDAFILTQTVINGLWKIKKGTKPALFKSSEEYDKKLLSATMRFIIGSLFSKPLRAIPSGIKLMHILSKPSNDRLAKVVNETLSNKKFCAAST